MYILTRTEPLENSKNNIYWVHAADVEEQYMKAGYQRHERSYKIEQQNKEYCVICPEFRNDRDGAEAVVIIPEFLVPGRPYPVYVYMYAIGLYSNAPEKGQRWAAEEARKEYGLMTFAHTTLGRALKAFVDNMFEAETAADGVGDNSATGGTRRSFPIVGSTAALRRLAAHALSILPRRPSRQQAVAACCWLAGERSRMCRRLLL